MATTLSAIKGKLGTTEYYVVTMKAGELAAKLTIPKEMEGWEDLSVEELYQREINDTRVEKFIAPYLANDPDRFFGSLIVAMLNADDIEFEHITDVAKNLPKAYRTPAKGIGFLTLDGGEILVPLDGQHRLRAIQYAISGKNHSGKDIEGIEPSTDLAKEDITVMLIVHDPDKSRKIFSKVNRYAKQNSKAQNLLTDDDDIIAVITRRIVNDIFASRVVNIKSNTLSPKAKEFTTLATIYDSVDAILHESGHKINKSTRPSQEKEKIYIQEVHDVWEVLVEDIDYFYAALSDVNETGDEKRREIRKNYLLGKPITQLCLVQTFIRMKYSKKSDNNKPSNSEICKALNSIDWSFTNTIWQRVLMNGTKVASGKPAIALSTQFIAYLAGENMTEEQLDELLKKYSSQFPADEIDSVELPERNNIL